MSFSAKPRHNSGGGALAPPNPQEVKQKQKERILTVLTRLNDRDTQKFAADELQLIIRDLDSQNFPILLNCLCSTGADQKVYSRRECARAMGFLTSDACPMRFLAMQNPYLNKILGQLKKAMLDSDVQVRDASADALGMIAMSLMDAEGELLVGSMANPVVKLIFDALTVQSKETQACASQALLAIAPSIGTLEKEVLTAIMKMLKSPAFLAAGSLLTAFASCHPELHLPVGMVQNTVEYLLPSLGSVLGQPAAPGTSGSGILNCLTSKDWQVRKAAADSLRALALLLGPHLEAVDPVWDVGNSASLCGRCIRALEICKFDKVRPVRDVVQDALTIMYELLEHGKANGAMEEWIQAVEERSQVKSNMQGGVHPASVAPPAHPSRPPSREKAGGVVASLRNSAVHEGFRQAAAEDIVVAAPRSRPSTGGTNTEGGAGEAREEPPPLGLEDSQAALDLPQPEQPPQQPPLPPLQQNGSFPRSMSSSPPPLHPGRQSNGHPHPLRLSTSLTFPELEQSLSPGATAPLDHSPHSHGSEDDPVVVIRRSEWERVQADLASLYESHRQLMSMVMQLSEDNGPTLKGLQKRVSALEEASMVTPFNLSASLTAIATASPAKAQATSPPQAPLSPPLPTSPPALPPPSHSPPPPPSLYSMRMSGDGMARPPSRLRSSSSGIPQDEINLSSHPSTPINPPSGGPSSPAPHTPHTHTPTSTPKTASPYVPRERPSPDLDAAYMDLVRCYHPHSAEWELQLNQLLTKTGPVWGELTTGTALSLLQTFVSCVEVGSLLPRIMPWLWRLADENCSPLDVPHPLRVKLLAALATCLGVLGEEAQLQERVKLLRSTLVSVWGARDTPGASPLASPLVSSRSLRIRSSLEGLSALQGQLDDMQRDFRSRTPTSPRSTRSEDGGGVQAQLAGMGLGAGAAAGSPMRTGSLKGSAPGSPMQMGSPAVN